MTASAPCSRARWAVILVAGIAGCSNDDPQTFRIDFSGGSQGWVAGFADYPPGEEVFYELEAEWRRLPDSLDPGRGGLYISGNNHSDDLWMCYKGRIGGLEPNRPYRVRFDLELATAVPSGCAGVGGAPGEDVTVKAGASTVEPDAVLEDGLLRMNLDKGQQTSGGANAVVVGDVANGIPCEATPRWELVHRSSETEGLEVTADESGSLWLFVGTDSGFEATTSLYYTWVAASLEPL